MSFLLREVLPGEAHLLTEAEHLRQSVRALQLEVKRLTIERDQYKRLNEMMFERTKEYQQRLNEVLRKELK